MQLNEPEQFRRAWMEMMGMPQEDIEDHIKHDPPVDLYEEVAQYNAMHRIKDSQEI